MVTKLTMVNMVIGGRRITKFRCCRYARRRARFASTT